MLERLATKVGLPILFYCCQTLSFDIWQFPTHRVTGFREFKQCSNYRSVQVMVARTQRMTAVGYRTASIHVRQLGSRMSKRPATLVDGKPRSVEAVCVQNSFTCTDPSRSLPRGTLITKSKCNTINYNTCCMRERRRTVYRQLRTNSAEDVSRALI